MQTREQKKLIVGELVEKLKHSKAVVFSNYKGLSVKDMTKLRRELSADGVSLSVVKKTLIDLALKNAGISASVKEMEGQIAIAVSSQDEVAAAKIINKFAKTNTNLKISGGILEGKLLSLEEVNSLSKLPSKEELLAKFVGTINAPVSRFVNVLSGNLGGLVRVLRAISESK